MVVDSSTFVILPELAEGHRGPTAGQERERPWQRWRELARTSTESVSHPAVSRVAPGPSSIVPT
jgi:hypothetical protein